MKLERRGKYPGIKVHLEPKEIIILIGDATLESVAVMAKLRRMLREALKEDSTLLDARTEDEIRIELEVERDKSIAKLAQMDGGGKWNE